MNGQIQSIVARIENLEDQKKALTTDIAEVYQEAKGNGFDVKILRKVIAKRKKSAVERSEEDAMIDVYMASLGMVPDSNIEISRRDGVKVTYSRAKTKPVERLASDHGAAAEGGESHSAAAIQIVDGRYFDREVGKSLTHETTDAGPSVAETQQRIAVKSVETDEFQSEHSDHDAAAPVVQRHAGGVEVVPSLDTSPAAHLEELLPPIPTVNAAAKADAARIDQSEPTSVAMMSVEERAVSAAPFDDDLSIPNFLKRAKPTFTATQILAAG